jgi:hypothetical protein
MLYQGQEQVGVGVGVGVGMAIYKFPSYPPFSCHSRFALLPFGSPNYALVLFDSPSSGSLKVEPTGNTWCLGNVKAKSI